MSRAKWRRYRDDNKKIEVFRVFLSHGSSGLRHKVRRFIEDELKFATEVLVDKFSGSVLLEKLHNAAWECECAVAIVTPDDPQPSGARRARQNVIHEIGFLQGFFKDEKIDVVVLLKEKSVEWFANLEGVECIEFEGRRISAAFPQLRKALETIYGYYKSPDDA